MKRWMKPVGIAMACLACCLPLIFAVAGVTTGAAGAVGFWLGRNEALIVAGLGVSYLLTVIIRHIQACGKPGFTTPTSPPSPSYVEQGDSGSPTPTS